MIPNENRIFLIIAILLVIILGIGYLVLDDDVSLKLPAHPIEQLKDKMHKESQ